MITKALVSFAEGQDYRNLLNVAIPSFYNYSNLHNYDLIIPSHKFVLDSCHEFGYKYGERSSSWLKIPIIKINATYNENDKNILIFGLKIKIPLIIECKLKIKMDSNIPIKIYDGKKWLNFNVCELNEIIQINDANKWRIAPSNEYINENKTNTFQFIISIYELTVIY